MNPKKRRQRAKAKARENKSRKSRSWRRNWSTIEEIYNMLNFGRRYPSL